MSTSRATCSASRRNLERIGEIMAFEISRTLRYRKETVDTPLAPCKCDVIDTQVVLATIFRAGIPFHQGFLNILDTAENAFVSAYRKYREKENFDVFIEYLASPRLDGKTLILVDPMLATGKSMELSYHALLTKGTPAHAYRVGNRLTGCGRLCQGAFSGRTYHSVGRSHRP